MACKTYHSGNYYLTYKRGFEDIKKCITITIEQELHNNVMKITLSDEEDPTFLYFLRISQDDYKDLKQQQGLLIEFDNFPAQLVRLLEQCAANYMFLLLVQANPLQFYLEFVEHNDFKRLVHLSLRCGPATDTEIKEHLAITIMNVKKLFDSLKSSASTTESILGDKCNGLECKIQDLSHALTQMEKDKQTREKEFQELLQCERDRLKEERMHSVKNVEMHLNAQIATLQEQLSNKDRQIEELQTVCRQLRENIVQQDIHINDKSQRLHLVESEVQKTHIEVATLKAKNSNLDGLYHDKDRLCKELKMKCEELEKLSKENSSKVKELTESVALLTKTKTHLEERLSITDSILTKKNEESRKTSDQLLKANQILAKQNSEIHELKNKILCRTAIALEQEKVIDCNKQETEELKGRLKEHKHSLEELKTKFEALQEKFEFSEKMLKDRDETIKNNNRVIQWLHSKHERTAGANDILHLKLATKPSATSSTPYFLQKSSQFSLGDDDFSETINFYESDQSHGEGNTTTVDTQPTSAQSKGLDPKYLHPIPEEKSDVGKKETGRSKSTASQKKWGKENKNVELPKVDYREKKAARSNTYRATPVSAYFP